MNFKTGQTYYIDQVFGAWYLRNSMPMRVVDKKIADQILPEFGWRTVLNKKSRKRERKLVKKYYNVAKKIATRYPDQRFAGGYVLEAFSSEKF